MSGSNLWGAHLLQLDKTEKGRWLFFLDLVHCHGSGSLVFNGICVLWPDSIYLQTYSQYLPNFYRIFIRVFGTTQLAQKNSQHYIVTQQKLQKKNIFILSRNIKSICKNIYEKFRTLFLIIWNSKLTRKYHNINIQKKRIPHIFFNYIKYFKNTNIFSE